MQNILYSESPIRKNNLCRNLDMQQSLYTETYMHKFLYAETLLCNNPNMLKRLCTETPRCRKPYTRKSLYAETPICIINPYMQKTLMQKPLETSICRNPCYSAQINSAQIPLGASGTPRMRYSAQVVSDFFQ